MPSRAEHRRTTLRSLSDAAIEAFERDGAAATVDEIAAAAGVSRRTVFRWVDSKEQLAFIHPILWFEVFDQALDALDSNDVDRSTAERLRLGSRAIAEHIDAEPEPVRQAFQTASAHPELAAGFGVVYQRWVDRVAHEVLPVEPKPQDHFRARIIGSATMGMVDAVIRVWVFDSDASFTALYDDAFELVAPLLEAEAGVAASGRQRV